MHTKRNHLPCFINMLLFSFVLHLMFCSDFLFLPVCLKCATSGFRTSFSPLTMSVIWASEFWSNPLYLLAKTDKSEPFKISHLKKGSSVFMAGSGIYKCNVLQKCLCLAILPPVGGFNPFVCSFELYPTQTHNLYFFVCNLFRWINCLITAIQKHKKHKGPDSEEGKAIILSHLHYYETVLFYY